MAKYCSDLPQLEGGMGAFIERLPISSPIGTVSSELKLGKTCASSKKCASAAFKSGNLEAANLTIGPGSPRAVNRANRILVAPMSATTEDRPLFSFLTFIYQDSVRATGGM